MSGNGAVVYVFFQQFSHPPPCENTTLSTTQDTLPNNSFIHAVNDTPDVDEVLSAAPDPIGPSTSCFPVMNNAESTLVPVHLQPTTVQSASVPTPIQPTVVQSSLPPVPPRIRDRIIRGEFIDFSSLLPKAMFTGGLEPETNRSFTLHVSPTNDDISVRPASNTRKIASFSSWMEAWNVYLSIRIDHTCTSQGC